MTNPLGFNAHLQYLDFERFVLRMRALQPAVVLGFIDSDNEISRVQALKAALPDTLVIGRMKHDQEGAFHLKPEAPGDTREYIASPQDVIARWGALGKNDLSLNLLNEPGTDNPDQVARLAKWLPDALDIGNAQNVRITGLNVATGQPPLDAALNQWIGAFDAILRAFSKYRDVHTLGIHEYMPKAGRIGRFNAMLKRCEVLGIAPPRFVITECGWDNDGQGSLNGYKSRGIPGGDYARQNIELIETTYRPAIDAGNLLGLCLFSYGNSGGWDKFDVENDDGFWDVLSGWTYVPQPSAPPVVVTPKPVTGPLPDPRPDNAVFIGEQVLVATAGKRTVRSGHSPLHKTVGVVGSDTHLKVFDPIIKNNNGSSWRYIESTVVNGWLQIDNISLMPIPPVPNFDPPVAPITPLDDNTQPLPIRTFQIPLVVEVKATTQDAAEAVAEYMLAVARFGINQVIQGDKLRNYLAAKAVMDVQIVLKLA